MPRAVSGAGYGDNRSPLDSFHALNPSIQCLPFAIATEKEL